MNIKTKWIISVLTNDENGTDDELIEYFMKEGNMKREEAEKWVEQRQYYL